MSKNKMNEQIKLPVRYDGEYIRDADNQPIGLADAVEIVAALNEADALRAEVEMYRAIFERTIEMRGFGWHIIRRRENNKIEWLSTSAVDGSVFGPFDTVIEAYAAIKPNAAAGEEGTDGK